MIGVKKFKSSLSWHIAIQGEFSDFFSSPFFQIMHFEIFNKGQTSKKNKKINALHFVVKTHARNNRWRSISTLKDGNIRYSVGISRNKKLLFLQMIRLSQSIAICSGSHGAILLHAALAASKHKGVLLCGPSGSGKTTSSKRLPPPWRSLSDDATLLVQDNLGRYWAYPWPTWSRFPRCRKKGSWPLLNPVRLSAICFLKKTPADEISTASPRESIIQLMASSEQAVHFVSYRMPRMVQTKHRMDRFNLCCDLVKAIPCFHLGVSLSGKFWEKIEQKIASLE